MSVLSRRSTVPAQRTPELEEQVGDLPRRRHAVRPLPAAPVSRRAALILTGGAVLVATALGTTVSFLMDGDGSASPAVPATSVDVPFDSEAKRDAATAARHGAVDVPFDSEAKRDAATAARHGSR